MAFNRMPKNSPYVAAITIMDPETDDPFLCENLSIIELEVANTTNKDPSDFSFGVTLPEGYKAILLQDTQADRMQVVTSASLPSPQSPLSFLDFKLKPFNRGQVYKILLYVELPAGVERGTGLKVSTAETGFRMTEFPSTYELLRDLLSPSPTRALAAVVHTLARW